MSRKIPFRKISECADKYVRTVRALESSDWFDAIREDWDEILSASLSSQLIPEKIWFRAPLQCKGGVLFVRAFSHGAAIILHHESLVVKNSINSYFKQDIIGTVKVLG